MFYTRDGVEDARLEGEDTKKSEAKAKGSLSEDRPSRGQGQECSRTKDTAASVLQKKNLHQKSSSGDLQFIGVARIFDRGVQITCNDVIKNFQKTYCGTKLSWDGKSKIVAQRHLTRIL